MTGIAKLFYGLQIILVLFICSSWFHFWHYLLNICFLSDDSIGILRRFKKEDFTSAYSSINSFIFYLIIMHLLHEQWMGFNLCSKGAYSLVEVNWPQYSAWVCKPMCFYQGLRLQKREELILRGRGWVKGTEEACMKENRAWRRRRQHEQRPGVGGPAVDSGWSWKGQTSWGECQDMKLRDKQKPVYEECHRPVFFRGPFTCCSPDGHSSTGKEKRTFGCSLSFHFLVGITSYTFYYNYMWKRIYHYPCFMNEELDAQWFI